MNKLNTGITVTQSAWLKLREILHKSKNSYGFLYSCSSGGCNGFNFKLNLLEKEYYDKIKDNKYLTVMNDPSNNSSTNKLYVDPLSEMYLLGTSINYEIENFREGIFESKFIFGINKEIMSSCGCGISFSPKTII